MGINLVNKYGLHAAVWQTLGFSGELDRHGRSPHKALLRKRLTTNRSKHSVMWRLAGRGAVMKGQAG